MPKKYVMIITHASLQPSQPPPILYNPQTPIFSLLNFHIGTLQSWCISQAPPATKLANGHDRSKEG